MRAIVLDRPGGQRLPAAASPGRAVRRDGRAASCAVSPFRIYNDELTIAGSMAVLRSFGAAVDLLSSGAVDPRALLAEPLPLAGFGTAVDRVRAGQEIKWHIRA